MSTVRAPLWRLIGLVRPHLPRIGLAGVVAGAAELAGVALIATATWLLAQAWHQPPLTSLTVAIVAVRTFAIGRGTVRYLDRLVGHDAVLRALADVRAAVFRAITPLAPGHTRLRGGGDLLTRLVSDVDAVQDLILRVWNPVVTAVVVGVATVGFTAVFAPEAALVLVAGLMVAGVLLPWLSMRVTRARAGGTARLRSRLADASSDLVRGAADLAAYGATARAVQVAESEAARLSGAQRQDALIAATVTLAGSVTAAFTVIGVFLSAPDLGVMTAVLALTVLVAFEAVAPLPQAAGRFTEVTDSVRRVVALLDEPAVVPDPDQPVSLPTGDSRLTLWDVRPRLPGRVDEGAGVTLDLPSGRRIAIVGPSGAGKSMLLSALVRFTPIAQGTVTFGGVDLVDLTQLRGDDVRSAIGGMLSDAYVFDTTVADNLRVAAPEATDDDLRAALGRAGLENVDLSDRVGEDGAGLSGGQRQRLLLARALLGDHRVLLLDEPTEHLDNETADAMTADILAATAGRSLILVTHRLAGLHALDEIVVLDGGTVVERGGHAELLAADGYYAHMVGRELISMEGRLLTP